MAPLRALLVFALVAGTAVSASAVPATSDARPSASIGGPPPAGAADLARASAPQADTTVTRVAVRADGDARWTVRVRTRLDSEADVRNYERFQAQFRDDADRYLAPFVERMRGVVAAAANATGREMAAVNFSASTHVQEVPRRWGVVEFSFTWTDFAVADGEVLVVGDAFEGGFFLTEGDSLVVEAPEGYVVRSVDPRPTDQSGEAVTWEGRTDFADQRPRVAFEPADGSTRDGGGVPGLAGGAALALALGVGVVLAGGAVVLGPRMGWRAPRAALGRVTPGGARVEEDPGDPPATVMTDGERVETLLAERGGRVKQAEVTEALGWSNSKTSRVVADLVEEGRVEKLRVGRENVLSRSE